MTLTLNDEQARQVREALFDARTELWGYANPSWSNKAANLCDKLDAAMKTLIIDTANADAPNTTPPDCK